MLVALRRGFIFGGVQMNPFHISNHQQRAVLQDDIDRLCHAIEHGYATTQEANRLPEMLTALVEWDEKQNNLSESWEW